MRSSSGGKPFTNGVGAPKRAHGARCPEKVEPQSLAQPGFVPGWAGAYIIRSISGPPVLKKRRISMAANSALNYLKWYVAITIGGSNHMRLHGRTQPKSFLVARVNQSSQDEAATILDGKNITYVRQTKTIRLHREKRRRFQKHCRPCEEIVGR
jgi:hypothetical protein